MKTSQLLALILLVISLIAGFLFRDDQRATQSTELSKPSPSPQVRTTRLESKIKPSPVTGLKSNQTPESQVRSAPSILPSTQNLKSQPGPPAPREENTVDVSVVNGLAIAHGDILLGSAPGAEAGAKGLAQVRPVRFWETAEIPYAIQPGIPPAQRAKIEAAITYLQQKTPVHMIPYQGQSDAIVFEVGAEHCISPLGRIGGMQPIRLDANCGTPEILHEIMHSLGFPHEQSRQDRDQYVEILWKNIEEKFKEQFVILPEVWMDAVRNSRFDPRSVMMYRADTFSTAPGLPSMRSLTAEPILPVKDGLSPEDIERLKRMFPLSL